MATPPNIEEIKAQGLQEPVWVAIWSADGQLLFLGAKKLPRHAAAINIIMRMLRSLEYWTGRPESEAGPGLPLLAALTSPN
ncbi:MAG: hypothetical protein C4567_18745 [Deltaproteobacteria bacterium]|nr:MAG: hypothetical protein C4567_18745 [Deltaproteobacteria bacterium]